jgi:hypothetical protein
MPDEQRHESADLGDYEVLDASDTLDGAPGDDPLDRGVTPPQRWSTASRAEQQDTDALDQELAAEEPDVGTEAGDDASDLGWDENATDEDIARLALDGGSDPRSGRLMALEDDPDIAADPDLVGYDAGIDGGGASAEEAAVHLVGEDSVTDAG